MLSSLQNQTWLCSHSTASVTSLLTKRNATSFYLGGSRNALELSNLPDMTWGIASGEGRISGELNLLCAYRDLFCGPPLPGIRSFIVTSEYDLSLYLHLSSSLVDEVGLNLTSHRVLFRDISSFFRSSEKCELVTL